MRLTQAAPGHNGARVARGDTLQHRSLVHCQGEILRPHKDGGLLVGPRARAWEEKPTFPYFRWKLFFTPSLPPTMTQGTHQPPTKF